MRWVVILYLASCLVLSGCSDDPTVDAKGSDEQRKASTERVKNALPEARQPDFEAAMRTLLFADVEGLTDLADGEGIARRFEDRVHGLTGEEVIAEAERVQTLRAERHRQRMLDQINELAGKIEAESLAEVSQFEVERARFKMSNGSGLGRDTTIELSVVNGAASAVSRVYFRALLLTPGREIPWVDAEFNYEIPGGLEPGERASWRLSPNMFGEWSKAPDDRLDTIFVVRTIQIDGADGESIGGDRLSEFDEERLRELLDGMEDERASEVRKLLDARQNVVQAWLRSAVPKSALQERDELEASRERLSQIRIVESRVAGRDSGLMSGPTVEALVENGTPSLIEWVRGQLRISSPDRQAPWDEGPFIGLIRHGMEPGSRAWVRLSKSSAYGMGRWSLPPEGTAFDVHVHIESVEAPESAPTFEIEFEQRDHDRLQALSEMIAAQGWQ